MINSTSLEQIRPVSTQPLIASSLGGNQAGFCFNFFSQCGDQKEHANFALKLCGVDCVIKKEKS
jgi:hypothetical protein